jgi:hypothetical protein
MMTARTKTRIKRALAMGAMFALGILTGVALCAVLVVRVVERHLDAPQVDAHHRMLRRQIARNLDLNDTEERAVEDALASQRAPHNALLREHELKLTPVRREAFSRMRASMRPHNQRALDAYLERLESRRFSRHSPRIVPPLKP